MFGLIGKMVVVPGKRDEFASGIAIPPAGPSSPGIYQGVLRALRDLRG